MISRVIRSGSPFFIGKTAEGHEMHDPWMAWLDPVRILAVEASAQILRDLRDSVWGHHQGR
jgi:hypothetical protein